MIHRRSAKFFRVCTAHYSIVLYENQLLRKFSLKVVVEMPGVTKSIIKISAYNHPVEIQTTENAERKYHEVIDLPEEADIETAKSVYNNWILEITLKKKDQTKPKGKQIKIE